MSISSFFKIQIVGWLTYALLISPVYANTCKDNQFKFEKIVRPMGKTLQNLRETMVRKGKITSEAIRNNLKILPSASGQALVEVSRIALGVSLPVLPPWYSQRKVGPKEFAYDMANAAKITATESWRLFKHVHQYVKVKPMDRSFYKAKTWREKVGRFFQQSALSLGSSLGILPVDIALLQTPVGRILSKQVRDPKYEPTPKEIKTLKDYKMYEVFRERSAFLKNKSWFAKIRYLIHVTAMSALFVSLLAAINQFLFHVDDGGMIKDDEFLYAPKFIPDHEQVQLVVDMVPFPHMSIRIGNEIYSYGQTHISKFSDAEYFKLRKLRKVNFDTAIENLGKHNTDINLDVMRNRGRSINGVSTLIDKLGLKNLPLSMQTITLNLGKDEVKRVRAELEASIGMQYINETGINDCATMVMRTLGMENRLIDASPSQLVMWFAMQKRLGSEVVGDINTVMVEDVENPRAHLYRNFAINVLESKLFIEFFVINQAERLYVDYKYPEKDDLQQYSEKAKGVMAEYEQEARKLLEADAKLQKYKRKMSRVVASGDRSRMAELESDIHRYFLSLRSEAKEISIESGDDLIPSIMASYRLALLEQYEIDLLKPLKR